jgi:hypothetical protein
LQGAILADDPQGRQNEYVKLVLKNVHDSLKWIFSIIIAGSAIRGASQLLVDKTIFEHPFANWRAYAAFFILSLVVFRFYWGWVRYLDVKYLETSELILIKRKNYFEKNNQALVKKCQDAFLIALKCARYEHIIADGATIFFQTVIIYILAGAIPADVVTLKYFAFVYASLLAVNATILTFISWQDNIVPPYHRDALRKVFKDKVELFAPDYTYVWIWNNACFAVIIFIDLIISEYYFPWDLVARDVGLCFLMLCNCLIDFYYARKMYSRNANTLAQAF